MSSFPLHLSPPFRTEHIGSLKRPDRLIEKRKGAEDGKVMEQDLTATEDECIEWVVKKQQELGFRAVTDGEYRYECSINLEIRLRGLMMIKPRNVLLALL
jgi:methionine synthase II (cobalamin-independent)